MTTLLGYVGNLSKYLRTILLSVCNMTIQCWWYGAQCFFPFFLNMQWYSLLVTRKHCVSWNVFSVSPGDNKADLWSAELLLIPPPHSSIPKSWPARDQWVQFETIIKSWILAWIGFSNNESQSIIGHHWAYTTRLIRLLSQILKSIHIIKRPCQCNVF